MDSSSSACWVVKKGDVILSIRLGEITIHLINLDILQSSQKPFINAETERQNSFHNILDQIPKY